MRLASIQPIQSGTHTNSRKEALNGSRVGAEFIAQLAERVGGAQRCAHLLDLSVDCLRLFRV